MSPFIVSKTWDACTWKSYKANKLYSGDLLMESNSTVRSAAKQQLQCISGKNMPVSRHRTLNAIRHIISEDDLLNVSECNILGDLTNEGVSAVKHMVVRREGKEINTKHLILTSEQYALSETFRAGYLNCRVRPLIPNPQHCFCCQHFGHRSRICRSAEMCAIYTSKEHSSDGCKN